ncbi:hypothetical protein [Halorientalis salina]|uniref:hypothetical protein n=1 Tax=Halorientalis salina TaxID=2932266 RepID=UPI00145D8CE1|nr:hypothetical protein [Halorientalis salina]
MEKNWATKIVGVGWVGLGVLQLWKGLMQSGLTDVALAVGYFIIGAAWLWLVYFNDDQ